MKHLPSITSAAAKKNITKNTRSSVECWDHSDKIKGTLKSINYPYFAKVFRFFVVKLKLLRKSSDFLLLGVTKITLVLRFMNSNGFYYVQTTKVVNSKDVNC